MFNEDHSLALVFNGEIYNFKELRKLLVVKGHVFKSSSDSEVLLHLYEEYGVECAKYLEGMFAFSIYDLRKKTLYLARDRVGEKPLYYIKDEKGFYFSSEIKSFYALDNFSKNLSTAGIHAYFNTIQIPAPQTIFEGVKKLRSAHWLLVHPDGKQRSEAYWYVDCTKKIKISLIDAKNHLKELMMDSVRKMLTSDVPVGVMLSGGVDSSLVAALAKEVGGGNFSTFTLGNSSRDANDEECIRARKIAMKLNVPNYVYDFGSSDFGELVDAVKLCDEPIGLLEIFYMFGIFKNIKEHVKVILTGNGADEIFAGYVSYNNIKRLANWTGTFGLVIQNNNSLFTSCAASYGAFKNWQVLKKLFSNEMKSRRVNSFSESLLSDAMSRVSYDNPLDAKLFMDLLVLCNHSCSAISDTAGMSQSVELRSPFLHHKVIEFAATLPLNYKVQEVGNPLYNKIILKELACDYFDREDVFIRKYGYGYFINTYNLMRTTWRGNIEDVIFNPLLHQAGLFNLEYVQNFWKRFLTGKENFRERLIFARFVMFCVWYKYKFSAS
jgi:asparagine synthase (glutamine-hydrolysing)